MASTTEDGGVINVTIAGDRPLIMHNGQMADPMNSWVRALRAISKKKVKTDDDHAEMARIEFMGSLYYHETIGVYIPGINIEGCIRDGARKKRRGVQVLEGVSVPDDYNPLIYKGPRTREALWDIETFRDKRGVKLKGDTTTIRCRPTFRDWALSFTLNFFTDVINAEDIREALDDAGKRIGLGDYHYRFGKFHVTKWQVSA